MFCLKVVTFCKFALIELYIFPFVRRVGGFLFGELAKIYSASWRKYFPFLTDDTAPTIIGVHRFFLTDSLMLQP